MPTAPNLAAVKTYLASVDATYDDADIVSALAAETAAQSRVVRLPVDPEPPADPVPYPADLAEALIRRTHRWLTLRAKPLGMLDSTTEYGPTQIAIGLDREVRRFEAPFRKMFFG